ncbi:gamma-glutamylcyclotransferase family protein [Novosphingobium sp.]|uniref:gamma-glutamylcyclotransferase family protein n=1 Tax=Novosphingobium sp. TaxID=1874826 RepID=UPI0028B04C89|nr:gamma-glutamylcyclotransferase family protein [Novosphingobium sp.]
MRKLRLFVYGTLQPQAGTGMGRWVGARMTSAEAAEAAGRIHAVPGGNGWFPALVTAKSGVRVSGTLCELVLRPGDLALLDRYEGREYRRTSVTVRTRAGRRVQAQVYLWRIAMPQAALPIPSGDYLSWLERTGRQAFTTPRNGA